MQATQLQKIQLQLEEQYGSLLTRHGNRSFTLHSDKVFIKVYTTKDAAQRLNSEVAFLSSYSNTHVPKILDHFRIQDHAVLVQENLSRSQRGFLDDQNILELSADHFVAILDVLLDIQQLEVNRVIVHGDLAAHNIYRAGDNFYILDWDRFHLAEKHYMRMYDYATLWAWLYGDTVKVAGLFDKVRLVLLERGLLEDFYTCFKLRVRNFEQDPELRHAQRARLVWEYILKRERIEPVLARADSDAV